MVELHPTIARAYLSTAGIFQLPKGGDRQDVWSGEAQGACQGTAASSPRKPYKLRTRLRWFVVGIASGRRGATFGPRARPLAHGNDLPHLKFFFWYVIVFVFFRACVWLLFGESNKVNDMSVFVFSMKFSNSYSEKILHKIKWFQFTLDYI